MVRIFFLFLIFSISVLFFPCASRNGTGQAPAGDDSVNDLSDSLADPLAVFLYQNLSRLSDDFILVGHQDALAYGMGWEGEHGILAILENLKT